jgi:hypothetical protein
MSGSTFAGRHMTARPDSHGVISEGQVLIANNQPDTEVNWGGDNKLTLRMTKEGLA